jgi:hypothetical protein
MAWCSVKTQGKLYLYLNMLFNACNNKKWWSHFQRYRIFPDVTWIQFTLLGSPTTTCSLEYLINYQLLKHTFISCGTIPRQTALKKWQVKGKVKKKSKVVPVL